MRTFSIIAYLAIALVAYANGQTNKQAVSRICGMWVYDDDLSEYNGLYLHEFRSDGAIILYNYTNGWIRETQPEINQIGTWEMLKNDDQGNETIQFTYRNGTIEGTSILNTNMELWTISDNESQVTRLYRAWITNGAPIFDREN